MYIYTLSLGSRSPKRIRGLVVVDVSQSIVMFYIKPRAKTMLQCRTPLDFYHHQPGSGDDASMPGGFGLVVDCR